MKEAPSKPSKCVAEGCGKDVLIGKFESHKMAYCDEHKHMKPKPTPPGQKKAADPPVDHAAVPGDPKPIAETPIPAAGPSTATAAAPMQSPPPTDTKPVQAAPPAPVVSAPVANQSTPKDLKDAFIAIVGQKLAKDKEKLAKFGFGITQHGIVNMRFPDGRLLSLIEIKGGCIGVGVTFNGSTEGHFDISTIHNLKPDERAAVIAAKDACL